MLSSVMLAVELVYLVLSLVRYDLGMSYVLWAACMECPWIVDIYHVPLSVRLSVDGHVHY